MDSMNLVDTCPTQTTLRSGSSIASSSSDVTADAMIDEALETAVYGIVSHIKYLFQKRKALKRKRVIVDVLKELHSLSVTIHGRMALADIFNDDESDLAPEIQRLFYVLVQTAPIEEWANRN